LNKKLRRKCGDSLKIEFGDYNQIISEKTSVSLYSKESADYQLLLCLNKDNSCISTISCKISKHVVEDVNNGGILEISSKTDPNYEGRKYNLLLRCAILLLAPHIIYSENGSDYNIIRVMSRAINPISILLMAKYFKASNHDLDAYMEQESLEFESLTLGDMQQFYDQLNEIPEFETEEEEMAYLENNENIGNPVLLYVDVSNPSIIDNTHHLFSNLVIRFRCPDAASGGRNMRKTKKTKRKTIKKRQKDMRESTRTKYKGLNNTR
jgi:hypothetical protein